MNTTQRILFNPNSINENNSGYLKIKLEQNVDNLEILSLNISTKDIYRNFNADYGVLVGRVIANGGVGIPNAKISIFIPLKEEDETNSNVVNFYPYKSPRDKNYEGKRYNLLPRVSKINPKTNILSPKQPFGSFPIKEELLTNEILLNVYKKYYKYTATTNDSGDYMIFGVPVGLQTVHMSVDITDIGKYSMTPAAMVTNLGYSPNFFTDNNTKIKPSNDLDDLPHIETQEVSVNIIPFWGDKENFEIGITRQDFRIRSTIKSSFIIFGSVFTDGERAMWGSGVFDDRKIDELYVMNGSDNDDDYEKFINVSIQSKRLGKVKEKIYYYPSSVSDEDIDSGNVDPKTQMVLLDPSEYSAYKRDGDFVFIINCNRRKVITDEYGNEVEVEPSNPNGVFTEFRGFMTIEISQESAPLDWSVRQNKQTFIPLRARLKIPQSAPVGCGLTPEKPFYNEEYNQNWRKQSYKFKSGCFYSIAVFNGTVNNEQDKDSEANKPDSTLLGSYSKDDKINTLVNLVPIRNTGVIISGDIPDFVSGNSRFEMVYNSVTTVGGKTFKLFGANWLNFTAYLPQFGFVSDGYAYIEHWRSNTNFVSRQYNKELHFYEDNTQPIAAGDYNTKWFARSDLHYTDFIEVPETDIVNILNDNNIGKKKGFVSTDLLFTLTGTYKNGLSPCPINGGKLDGNPTSSPDSKIYFYRGFDTADCLQYLVELGIIKT